MSDTPHASSRSPLRRGDDRLFLTEVKLRQSAELMFFAYRYFTKDPDKILSEHDYGRAHHRALHFIASQPGLSVADLLDILGITKQSLARVLKPLVEDGLVRQEVGSDDRRKRLLFLTEEGITFERSLAAVQRDRLSQAFRDAGPEAVAGFRHVLELMVDADQRGRFLSFTETSTLPR